MTNTTENLDRLPPHSVESEQATIGCVLISPNDCMTECCEKLGSDIEAFYELRHQIIFAELLKMFEEQVSIDIITLQQRLKDSQLLEQIGGIEYLFYLRDRVPSAANLSYYLEFVMDKHTLRKVMHTCTSVIRRVYEYEGEVSQLLDETERDILSIRNFRAKSPEVSVRELVNRAVVAIEALWERGGAIAGLSTGLSDLDRLTDGLQPGQMIVVAGYPGSGKTALAMNVAEHVSLVAKQAVGVYSLEMPAEALVTRFMFSNARINGHAVKRGNLSQGDMSKLTTASVRIAGAPIHFDDSSELSILNLRASVRRMHQKHGIKLLVVDYIQLLNAVGGARKVESRQQEVTDISRGIKAISRELNIPVLALSQLNDDGRLRESRAIGQDADGIWILKKDENANSEGAVILDVVKNRNGPTGPVWLTFLKPFTRFENAARVADEDVPRKPYNDNQ